MKCKCTTGPDHLAAIIPASVGQDFLGGIRIGGAWGLGHGITASIIGIFAFFLKGKVSSRLKFLEQLSGFADSAVGISLLAIGLIGVKESLASNDDTEKVVDTEDSSMYYVPPTGRGISLVTTVLEMINFDSNLYRTQ